MYTSSVCIWEVQGWEHTTGSSLADVEDFYNNLAQDNGFPEIFAVV
jgi:hypothetical protein